MVAVHGDIERERAHLSQSTENAMHEGEARLPFETAEDMAYLSLCGVSRQSLHVERARGIGWKLHRQEVGLIWLDEGTACASGGERDGGGRRLSIDLRGGGAMKQGGGAACEGYGG